MALFKPRPVGDFLRRRKLKLLQREAEAQQSLLKQVRALLTAPLEPHCTAARLSEGQLVLFADSSAWASRLRYLVPDILEGLRRAGVEASAIRIRVALESPSATQPPARPKQPARRLSAANAELLLQVAASMTDPALGAALRRLGRHRRQD